MDAMIKNLKLAILRYKDCNFFLEYTKFKNDLIGYNCLCCNKNFKKSLIKPKKRLFNTYKFSNHGINKFVLLLQKSVFPHMNTWMIGRNSMKHHYLKRKSFTVT